MTAEEEFRTFATRCNYLDGDIGYISKLFREAKVEAYEEAIKAACGWCHAGWSDESREHEGVPFWVHPTAGVSPTGEPYEFCKASNIRALRDSLVAESFS